MTMSLSNNRLVKDNNQQYHVLVLEPTLNGADSIPYYNYHNRTKGILRYILQQNTIVTLRLPTNTNFSATSIKQVDLTNARCIFNIVIELLCCETGLCNIDKLQVIDITLTLMSKSSSPIDYEIVKQTKQVSIEASMTSIISSSMTFNVNSLSLRKLFHPDNFKFKDHRLLGITLNNLFSEQLSYLVELDLSKNCLDDKFLITFSHLLLSNKKLEILRLSSNSFTDIGITVMASVFYYNATLQFLDVSDNLFQSDGLFALTTSLQYNPSLTYLDISSYNNNNRISEQYLSKALLFLQYNQSIISLYCWNHGDETVLRKTFYIILLYNQTIEILNNHVKITKKARFHGLRRRQRIFAYCEDLQTTNQI
jgi:Leucine Rich repeat